MSSDAKRDNRCTIEVLRAQSSHGGFMGTCAQEGDAPWVPLAGRYRGDATSMGNTYEQIVYYRNT